MFAGMGVPNRCTAGLGLWDFFFPPELGFAPRSRLQKVQWGRERLLLLLKPLQGNHTKKVTERQKARAQDTKNIIKTNTN